MGRHRFGAQPAAGRAQFADLVEQAVLPVGWQVPQQALGDPGCRGAGVEAGSGQCRRPVLTEIDADGAQLRGRLGAEAGQSRRLELDHLGLVDLVDHHVLRPTQSVGAGVQTGRQDDGLADSGGRRVGEEVVEEASPGGHAVGESAHPDGGGAAVTALGVQVRGGQLAGGEPGEEVDSDRAYQGRGERIVDHRLVGAAGDRACGGDHRRGGAHAGGEIPGVVVSTWHAHPSRRIS